MIYGYARCSTNEKLQDINRQVRELKQQGAIDKSIYLEYVLDTDDAERKVNVRYFSLPKTEVDPVIEFYGNGTLLKGIIN